MTEERNKHIVDIELTKLVDKYGETHVIDLEELKKDFLSKIKYSEVELKRKCQYADDKFEYEELASNLSIDDLGKYDPTDKDSYYKFIVYYYEHFHLFYNESKYNNHTSLTRYKSDNRDHLKEHQGSYDLKSIISSQYFNYRTVFKINLNDENYEDYLKFIFKSGMLDITNKDDRKFLRNVIVSLFMKLKDASKAFNLLHSYGLTSSIINNLHKDIDSQSILETLINIQFNYENYHKWAGLLLEKEGLLEKYEEDDVVSVSRSRSKSEYDLYNTADEARDFLNNINSFTLLYHDLDFIHSKSKTKWVEKENRNYPYYVYNKVDIEDFYGNIRLEDVKYTFSYHTMLKLSVSKKASTEKRMLKFLKKSIISNFSSKIKKNNHIVKPAEYDLSMEILETYRKEEKKNSKSLKVSNWHHKEVSYDVCYRVYKGIRNFDLHKDSHNMADGNSFDTCVVREITFGNKIPFADDIILKHVPSYKDEDKVFYITFVERRENWYRDDYSTVIHHIFKIDKFINNEKGLYDMIAKWFNEAEFTNDYIESILDNKNFEAKKLIEEKLKEVEKLKKLL
jgi:hypothetical protein